MGKRFAALVCTTLVSASLACTGPNLVKKDTNKSSPANVRPGIGLKGRNPMSENITSTNPKSATQKRGIAPIRITKLEPNMLAPNLEAELNNLIPPFQRPKYQISTGKDGDLTILVCSEKGKEASKKILSTPKPVKMEVHGDSVKLFWEDEYGDQNQTVLKPGKDGLEAVTDVVVESSDEGLGLRHSERGAPTDHEFEIRD